MALAAILSLVGWTIDTPVERDSICWLVLIIFNSSKRVEWRKASRLSGTFVWEKISNQSKLSQAPTRNPRNTHLVYIISRSTGEVPVMSKPVTLYFHLKSTLKDRVACQFREWTLREFVNLFQEVNTQCKKRTQITLRLTWAATEYSSSKGSCFRVNKVLQGYSKSTRLGEVELERIIRA